MWQSGDWWFHHDNAPAHTAISVTTFMARNSMAVLPHPPHSPDVAPSDFFLFPRVKRNLKGMRFADVEEVKRKRRRRLQTSKKMSLKIVSNNGRREWASALLLTESTLKEIKGFLYKSINTRL